MGDDLQVLFGSDESSDGENDTKMNVESSVQESVESMDIVITPTEDFVPEAVETAETLETAEDDLFGDSESEAGQNDSSNDRGMELDTVPGDQQDQEEQEEDSETEEAQEIPDVVESATLADPGGPQRNSNHLFLTKIPFFI